MAIDEARHYLSAAENNLEAAVQNYYDSQNGPEVGAPSTEASQPFLEEDEVRPVLPREYSQLIEDESIRNVNLLSVKRQFQSFRDLKREMEIQEDLASGGTAKRTCLEDIYRNPIDVTCNLDIHSAKLYGQKLNKWIILLINDESFPSLCLNRDIFNERTQEVKRLIKKNFILLRKRCDDIEGSKLLQNYNIVNHSIPALLIIDSVTGELKKNFGDTRNLTLKNVIRELKKFSCADNQLKYNSSLEDSDDDLYSSHFGASSSASNSNSASLSSGTAISKPTQQKQQSTAAQDNESDNESFASLNSDEDAIESDTEEPKVLDSDEEILNTAGEPQTNILLKLNDANHSFKYPSSRTVRQLINYIYRNYLVQTGIYDDRTKRFVLFSKIHNNCLTNLNQEESLTKSKIHPSIVLMHNTFGKET